MMGSAAPENPYGLKLYIDAVQEKARRIPHHTYLRYPGEDWENKGYSTITWKQHLDSINKIAHWLDEQLGQCASNETFVYSGPNDVRYGLVFGAAIKTNRKFLVCDGRLTGEGLKSLLNATDCKAWLAADDSWTLKAAGLEEDKIKTRVFPSLEWCVDSAGTPDYPYDKTWEEAKYDEIAVIHTSGTTGFPKPIFTTNGYWSLVQMNKIVAKKYWPQPLPFDVQSKRVGISAYPPKWGAGLAYMTVSPVFTDHVTIVLPPGSVGVPPELFRKVLHWNPDAEGLHSAPQPVAGLWNDPTTQPLLKQLEFIIYAGASLDQAIGDELSKHTRVFPVIGSTEAGIRLYTLPKDRKLWNSFGYIPEGPHHFVKREGHSDAEELYELVIDRPEDGQPSWFHGAFWNFKWYKDVDHVETRELYAPVRDADGTTRWVFKARTDDLTKLSFLAKFNATHIETRVLRHPAVKHVLVGGEGRPAPYVLVELKEGVLDSKPADAVLDDIYHETVALSNKEDIGEIRIPRQTVFLAKKEKPFKINLKAVVLRREVEREYQEEIDSVYKEYEIAVSTEGASGK